MEQKTANPPIRVLIVDDDEDDFFFTSDFIRHIPGQAFDIDWCDNYNDAVKRLRDAAYDIYFIDYRLNVHTGIDVLKEANALNTEAPIVLLTGKGNQKIDMEAMHLGAADYLIKSDLNPEKLERCIRYALEHTSTLRKLRASERKYRNLFEKTNDIIFITDDKLKLTNVNFAATSILGYSPEQFSTMALPDLLANDIDREILKKQLASGKVDDLRVEFLTLTKEKKLCIVSASVETSKQGTDYIQGIIHDISLLKKAEDITLQSEKLEAKGRVIRTLAHEVRNPLNNITLSIENMKAEAPGQVLEYIEIIQRNSKRIDDLINELMDSSRFYKMNLAVMSLQSVMDDAITAAADRINLHRIKLKLDYAQQAANAMLDRDKMKIAFLNIIINAIEASSERGPGELSITIIRKPDFHEVKIKDNGVGMNEEQVEHLFESYFTSKPTGLGLGLATTHAIIQSHKATIRVQSKPGDGAEFTIMFPAL